MSTILITGSTDGIGLEAAKVLIQGGHTVLVHGRNPDKAADVEKQLAGLSAGKVETFVADLSRASEVIRLADEVVAKHPRLDVLINNAGVFHTSQPRLGPLDVRFVVNLLAPRLLTERLLPQLPNEGRIINLSSAAQQPVDLEALRGSVQLNDMAAYAQSKLAITMWSLHLASKKQDISVIPVNPGSMLGTNMVKDAFGVSGKSVGIGADILARLATSEEFSGVTGRYFDNDGGRFADPHPAGLYPERQEQLLEAMDEVQATWVEAFG